MLLWTASFEAMSQLKFSLKGLKPARSFTKFEVHFLLFIPVKRHTQFLPVSTVNRVPINNHRLSPLIFLPQIFSYFTYFDICKIAFLGLQNFLICFTFTLNIQQLLQSKGRTRKQSINNSPKRDATSFQTSHINKI